MPNDSPLHRACFHAKHNGSPLTQCMLEELVKKYGIDCRGTYERTPFIFAAVGGHVEIMSMLRDWGAKVDGRDKVQGQLHSFILC